MPVTGTLLYHQRLAASLVCRGRARPLLSAALRGPRRPWSAGAGADGARLLHEQGIRLVLCHARVPALNTLARGKESDRWVKGDHLTSRRASSTRPRAVIAADHAALLLATCT